MELVDKPVVIHEHKAPAYECGKCGRVHYAPFPPEVEKGGLAGPRLTALVAYLKGACHASFTTIQGYFRDCLKAPISRGQLAKIVSKATDALEAPYAELLDRLPGEARVNVDETGHKDSGDLLWTWCFRAEPYTLFKIIGSRGSKVLIEVLGEEFNGVLGCDYFSAYRKYMKDFDILVQFCLAHLVREVKFLAEHPDAATEAYGKRLLSALREMFGVIHRRGEMTPRGFRRSLRAAKRKILKQGTRRVPPSRGAQNLAKRFRKHGEAYFRFITTPGVEPTNNVAEQAIRFVVIDRRVTQGTRGEKGRRWCERIWTVVATCARQGRSAYEFILTAVRAHFAREQAPSLLPMPP
jgi:transposase